ncbi:DUF6220 domain-containing protein [Krasilnikovia sp. MM14-A1259]|uniref:DUF6220 domain-containing protein n=1 Tax=Krasilnikovia sp. MM14-A1259 TaxID=3373539 RepID=UPI0038248371
MRAVYRVLAMLIAIGVVVQAATVAWGWFAVLHDTDSGAVYDKNSGDNAGQAMHSVVGMMVLPTIAVLLLIVAFFARIPGGVKWAAITLGVTVLQVLLAELATGAPVVGALHGINAFVIAFAASLAMRQARLAGKDTPAEPAAPAAAG